MKKNKLIKYTSFFTLIILMSLFSFTYFSHAEDEDENEFENDDNRPTILKTVEPVLIPKITETPVTPMINQDVTPTVSQPAVTQKISSTVTSTAINNNLKPVINNANLAALESLIDSDGDGIPDIKDMHPGEDDFAYILIDNNKNGIADDLEILLK